ncbi:hypothetical protein [Novosphingobium sp. B 225]|uniref:hypothetical protein n=1 Tax=Novosphingobium sp. B 225 TaxID=1961849 RepID=UPI00112510EA|nr:hypothetical protein [Novosphingobium sp. B 225]
MHNARNRRAATLPKRPAKPPAMAHAAMGGQVPSFLLRPVEPPAPALRGFPADVLIPPHRGAMARAISLAEPVTATAKPKRKPKAKRPPKLAKRKKAAAKSAAVPVIALPNRPEPLVALDAAPPSAPLAPLPRLPLTPSIAPAQVPLRPLPRRRTLAPWRPAGLAAQIGAWLLGRSRKLAALLAPRPGHRPAADQELARLRAENERLRLQIEALLALRPESAPASG